MENEASQSLRQIAAANLPDRLMEKMKQENDNIESWGAAYTYIYFMQSRESGSLLPPALFMFQ